MKKYHKDCNLLFGAFLHHFPTLEGVKKKTLKISKNVSMQATDSTSEFLENNLKKVLAPDVILVAQVHAQGPVTHEANAPECFQGVRHH